MQIIQWQLFMWFVTVLCTVLHIVRLLTFKMHFALSLQKIISCSVLHNLHHSPDGNQLSSSTEFACLVYSFCKKLHPIKVRLFWFRLMWRHKLNKSFKINKEIVLSLERIMQSFSDLTMLWRNVCSCTMYLCPVLKSDGLLTYPSNLTSSTLSVYKTPSPDFLLLCSHYYACKRALSVEHICVILGHLLSQRILSF